MEINSNSPLISIIIPVYGVEDYIKNCIESVINQTYKKFECIIVDDGTFDRSIEIAKETILADKRFKIYHKKNGGLSSARNFGMKLSSGELIAFLDADDKWKPNKIRNQVNYISKNPHVDLVYSNCEIFDGQNYLKYEGKYYSGNPLELLQANTIVGSGSSVIIKRIVYEKVGFFNESLNSFEDLEYWFRIAINEFAFYFIPSIDITIEKRNNSLSKNLAGMMNANQNSFNIQLNELLNFEASLSSTNKSCLKRIKNSRKYFAPKKPFLNLYNYSTMIFIYLFFLLKRLKKKLNLIKNFSPISN